MKLPNRALTNIDLYAHAKRLKIPHFRGVFMRDDLPNLVRATECGIVNLDNKKNPGTHWCAYLKRGKSGALYFDSFGNLQPPKEMVKYLSSRRDGSSIKYNHQQFQTYDSENCGHLCLSFLHTNMR